jgi:hypothetical protein
MSRTTGCRGWTNPVISSTSPVITALSSTSSISGSTTIVAIFGSGFTIYSQVHFGEYIPESLFIKSGQINFYVPVSAISGSYPIQVFNDSKTSNIVTYNIDLNAGPWNVSSGSDILSNSNTGGVNISGSTTITGTTTIINSATTINGSLIVSGSVSANNYITTSDYRIKDIIEPLNASYSVDNLKPIKYLNKISGKTEIGLIAHELQNEFPCLVTGEKDGEELQTVNYSGLIGILINEIQGLKTEIQGLKTEIQGLIPRTTTNINKSVL